MYFSTLRDKPYLLKENRQIYARIAAFNKKGRGVYSPLSDGNVRVQKTPERIEKPYRIPSDNKNEMEIAWPASTSQVEY